MANKRGIAAAALALLLAGCSQGATVDVRQTAGLVTVAVTRPPDAGRPCVDDLDVVPLEPAGAPAVWHVMTADADMCVDRFVLGQVPTGFAQDAPLGALVKGRKYRVEISGTGFIGAQSFTVDTGAHDPAVARPR